MFQRILVVVAVLCFGFSALADRVPAGSVNVGHLMGMVGKSKVVVDGQVVDEGRACQVYDEAFLKFIIIDTGIRYDNKIVPGTFFYGQEMERLVDRNTEMVTYTVDVGNNFVTCLNDSKSIEVKANLGVGKKSIGLMHTYKCGSDPQARATALICEFGN